VDFQVVLAGFLARAAEIASAAAGPDVAFLLVLAPEVAAVDEAMYFHGRLRQAPFRSAASSPTACTRRPARGRRGARRGAAGAAGDAGRPRAIRRGGGRRLAGARRSEAEALHASERRELARLAASAPAVP